FFFNILVLRRYISLRLIVVVVGDKKLDPVIWEEVAKLSVKLSSECFIVAHHQCRALFLINNISNGTCFTGTGYSKQRLILITLFEPFHQLFDSLRLIAGWLPGRLLSKIRKHCSLLNILIASIAIFLINTELYLSFI